MKETLEEAARNWLYNLENTNPIVIEKKYPLMPMEFGFIEGAKWMQERSYSEEEVKLMFNRYNEFIAHHDCEEWQDWIDQQFKK